MAWYRWLTLGIVLCACGVSDVMAQEPPARPNAKIEIRCLARKPIEGITDPNDDHPENIGYVHIKPALVVTAADVEKVTVSNEDMSRSGLSSENYGVTIHLTAKAKEKLAAAVKATRTAGLYGPEGKEFHILAFVVDGERNAAMRYELDEKREGVPPQCRAGNFTPTVYFQKRRQAQRVVKALNLAAFAIEATPQETNPKVEIFVIERKHVPDVTRPEPVGSPWEVYVHEESIFVLTRKHVKNCRLRKEVASVFEDVWRWVVQVELTEETKAELGRRFRAMRPQKTQWWKTRLNGTDWCGESTFHQTADPSTRFAEVAVFVTKDRSEAERVKQSFLEPAKPVAHFRFNNGLEDIAGADSRLSIQNVQFRQGALFSDGQSHDSKTEPFRLTTPSLDYRSFTVAFRFKAEGVGRGSRPILFCGPQTCWFRIQSNDGNLTVHLKSGDKRYRSTVIKAGPIEAGQWYDVVCCVRRREQEVRLYLNGKALKPEWIAEVGSFRAEAPDIGDRRFRLVPISRTANSSRAGATDISQSEKVWLLRDPQDGSTFHGLIDELVIFERALTEGEALAFNQSQIDH